MNIGWRGFPKQNLYVEYCTKKFIIERDQLKSEYQLIYAQKKIKVNVQIIILLNFFITVS